MGTENGVRSAFWGISRGRGGEKHPSEVEAFGKSWKREFLPTCQKKTRNLAQGKLCEPSTISVKEARSVDKGSSGEACITRDNSSEEGFTHQEEPESPTVLLSDRAAKTPLRVEEKSNP